MLNFQNVGETTSSSFSSESFRDSLDDPTFMDSVLEEAPFSYCHLLPDAGPLHPSPSLVSPWPPEGLLHTGLVMPPLHYPARCLLIAHRINLGIRHDVQSCSCQGHCTSLNPPKAKLRTRMWIPGV